MKKLLNILVLVIVSISANAQIAGLRNDIEKLVIDKQLKIGVALLDLSNNDSLFINSDDKFPMQSVYKLPIALCVLHQVDEGKLKLTDTIRFAKADLYEHIWSPIQKANLSDCANLLLSEVINYTIQQSDNSGCDKLIEIAGGTENINNYIHSLGVTQINILNNELEIQSDWNIQYNNWITPQAAITLMEQISSGKLLSVESQDFLWASMLGTATGSIRKYLPSDIDVAYKTGFSGQNSEGLTAANNNIGIMLSPNGRKVAYAIFITDSYESKDVNYEVIAQIGKLIANFVATK